MPNYVYRCPDCEAELDITELMHADKTHECDVCGAVMSRKPQRFMVNWRGLPPSRSQPYSPEIREMIDGADERRDLEVKHESSTIRRANARR